MSEAREHGELSAEQPWPGLMPFTEGAQEFFHGRDQETAELFRLIRRETVTVLFGQSGLGKSSLLNAGLFPRLRAEDFFPVYVRLDVAAQSASFTQQVHDAIESASRLHRVEAPAARPNDTLWEFLHRKGADFWSARNRLLVPVLVFDQFEELFTLGRHGDKLEERCSAFLQELSDLAENRVPASVSRRLEEQPALSGELDFARRTYKVVLTFREDYLPDFEGLRGLMPSIMHNRMRLTRMNGVQAREAVLKPTRTRLVPRSDSSARLVTGEVADQIVRFVASPRFGAARGGEDEFERLEVEPALLSVVCRELNNKRIRARSARITADLLQGGAQQQIIQEFYEASLAGVDSRVREFVEDQLLTEAGYRDSYALDDALQLPGVTMQAIDTLIARRLLRLEERSGVRRVELTHDVLTKVAKESRDQRQSREAERVAREREETRRRRVRRVATIGGVAGAGALGLAVVFAVLLQRSNEEKRRLIETQSNVLLEQASQNLDDNIAGEAPAQLAESLRLNPANSGATGRAVAYLSQRTFPRLLLHVRFDARGEAVRWRDADTVAIRDARSVTLVPAKSGAPMRYLRMRGSGDRYENFGLAALEQAADKSIPPSAKPLAAFDENTRTLAWLGSGSMLNLADLDSGAKIGTSLATGRDVTAVTVSADRSTMAWIEGGQRVRIARLDGSRALTLEDGPAYEPLVLSPDGKWLVLGGTALYDLRSDKPAMVFGAAATEPQRGKAAFTPDARYLIASRGTTRFDVVDVELRKIVGTFSHQLPVNSLEISPQGNFAVTACQDKFTRIWALPTGRLAVAPLRHDSAVLTAHFSPDGSRVITGALDGTARIWAADSGRQISEPLVAGADVADARISADGRMAFTYTSDARLAVWDISGGSDNSQAIEVAGISNMDAHGARMAIASASPNEVSLFDLGSERSSVSWAKKIWTVRLRETITGLRFSPDGATLAVAAGVNAESSTRAYVYLVDAKTGSLVGHALRHRGTVHALRFSADGRFLATGSEDGAARIWRVATQRLHGAPLAHSRQIVRNVAFNADGSLLLTGSVGEGGGSLQLWSMQESTLLAKVGTGTHLALADFSGGDVVAVYDNLLVKWAVEVDKARAADGDNDSHRFVEQARLQLGGLGWRAALSPQGERVVVGRLDGTARLISLKLMRPVGQPMKHAGVVEDAAFSADGRWVQTVSADRVARVWDSATGYSVIDPIRGETPFRSAALVSNGGFFVASTSALVTITQVGLDFPAATPGWLAELVQDGGGATFDRTGTLVWMPDREPRLRALATRIRDDTTDSWWQKWGQDTVARMIRTATEMEKKR